MKKYILAVFNMLLIITLLTGCAAGGKLKSETKNAWNAAGRPDVTGLKVYHRCFEREELLSTAKDLSTEQNRVPLKGHLFAFVTSYGNRILVIMNESNKVVWTIDENECSSKGAYAKERAQAVMSTDNNASIRYL